MRRNWETEVGVGVYAGKAHKDLELKEGNKEAEIKKIKEASSLFG